MPKKPNLDNAAKRLEAISAKVDIIMRNRLIIAFFLVVDGITFILNPDTTLPEMARGIILLVLLASISTLIAGLASKTKDRKTILISAAIVITSIIMYIYPDFISAYIQLLLSLFIIYEGLTNIASALNLNKLSKYTQSIATKYNKLVNSKPKTEKDKAEREKFKEIDNNLSVGLEEQKQKLINPLKNIIGRTNKLSKAYIIANVASIILGVILLIFPDVSMTLWGIIFIYTGLPNLIATMKSMDLFRKLKEKRFKEILFDADNKKS